MKPCQTLPIFATAAPLAALAPPVLIVAAIGLGLIWLFSEKNDSTTPPSAPENPSPPSVYVDESDAPSEPNRQKNIRRRITREDMAEALAYGARSMTRQEAVSALQAVGFQKSAAYKALSADGRFAELLEYTSEGLIEWKG